MNEHKAVPNIRFNSFKDEFKVGKLENFFDIKDGTHSSPQYINSGFPLVTSKNLTESGLKLENASYISKSDFDEINKRSKVDVGDILFGMIGTIGTPVMIKENNFAIKNVALIKEFSKPEVLNIWLIYYFQSPAFDKFIHFRSSGGTQKFLALGVIQNMKFKFPLKKEQQKIGNLFAKLDKLLDLQQQKIDKLELLKKALLQKLFPKHDADIPELRFKGFNDEWKGMKIGSLFDHKSGTSIEKYFNSDGKYKVISIGSYGKNSKYIDQGIRVNLNSVTKSHLVDKNDLTMVLNDKTSDGQIIGRVLLINKSNEFVINQRTERLIPRNINSKFAFTYLNGPIRKSIKKMVQGGTQIYINYSSIEKIDILVPKTIEEEQKIGNFLFKVDQLIELENKKLQNFQQLKKCLLQNMFVE